MENNISSENQLRPTVYPSGVDLWIIVMLMSAPITSLVIGCYLLQQGQSGGALTLFLCAAATASLTAAATIPCRYTLHEDALTVRCGLLCYQIPLSDITSITKSGTILSGPALSLKRVLIKTSKRTYILSPKKRDLFIANLEQSLQNFDRDTSQKES
ncbi:MAG: PH domain-containing protein [Rubripirellula sp.]